MSQSANDLRVTRSQRFIREALIDLIEERGFDALSVGEITARAMVSRATFYRHYRDKYDLVEQIYAEAMQALFGAIAVQQTVHSPQIWVTFFDHVAEYDRLYGALLGEKGSPWFVRKMRTSLINLIKEFGRAAPQWQSDSAHPISLYPAEDDLIPDGALARGTAPDPDIPKDVANAKWYEVPGIWWNTVERLSWTMVGKPAAYGCKFREVDCLR